MNYRCLSHNHEQQFSATYKVDFKPIDGDDNISIGPGGTSATVSFDIVDDNIDENNEAFNVELWSGSVGEARAKRYDSTAVVIVDNDTASLGSVRALKDVISINEGQQASVGFERINGSDGEIKYKYSTEPGSADPGSDFTEASGSLTWPDGDTSTKFVKVNTKNDTLDECDEDFYVYLSNGDSDSNSPGDKSSYQECCGQTWPDKP